MKQTFIRKAVSSILILAMAACLISGKAVVQEVSGASPEIPAYNTAPSGGSYYGKPLSGKTLSILGDSISSFQDYSNGAAYETTNSTLENNVAYYPGEMPSVTVEDTWWKQAAELLGLRVLVNNSWSGSCMLATHSGTDGAYLDRCVQLHDDTGSNAEEEPDIIAIYLGTNDYYSFPKMLGTYEEIDFDALIWQENGAYCYNQPITTMEAYAICLHKIRQRYPDAELYCFTLLPRRGTVTQADKFNNDIGTLAERFGAYIVDLRDCGVSYEPENYDIYMGKDVHPNQHGMDAITGAFVNAVLNNSEYLSRWTSVCNVTYKTAGVAVMEGTTWSVIRGASYEATLVLLAENSEMEVTVTMGSRDITRSCYSNGKIKINNVTADVKISAKDSNYVGKTGIFKASDGDYYYYQDDEIAESFTGLVENELGNWYVLNGKVQLKASGLITVDDDRYYIKGGCVTDFSGLKKLDGVWLYFANGRVDMDFVGLVTHNGMKAFVENGEVNFNKSGLFTQDDTIYYVRYGLWASSHNGMVKGDDGVWRYMEGGIFTGEYTGLAKNSIGWWYVQNGLIDTSFTGWCQNAVGKWYIRYGQAITNYNGFVKYLGSYWYIKDGRVWEEYTGPYVDDQGNVYEIVNGRVL